MPDVERFTSPLGKVIEQLLRTSYASNNAMKNFVETAKGESELHPVKSFLKGLKLEEKTEGHEVLSEIIGTAAPDAPTQEKLLRAVGGFAIDIFADPLTYVEIGALTKTGKLADIVTGLTKAEKKIEKGSKLGAAVAKYGAGSEILQLGKTLTEQAGKGQRGLFSWKQDTNGPAGQ